VRLVAFGDVAQHDHPARPVPQGGAGQLVVVLAEHHLVALDLPLDAVDRGRLDRQQRLGLLPHHLGGRHAQGLLGRRVDAHDPPVRVEHQHRPQHRLEHRAAHDRDQVEQVEAEQPPQTSTAPVSTNRNGVSSTRPNGPTLRLCRMLAVAGSSRVTISSRLCRQYSRDTRVSVHTNSAVVPRAAAGVLHDEREPGRREQADPEPLGVASEQLGRLRGGGQLQGVGEAPPPGRHQHHHEADARRRRQTYTA
jgi:hypothetical protein